MFAFYTFHIIQRIFDENRQTGIRYRSQYIKSHIQSDALLDGILFQSANIRYDRDKTNFHVLHEEVRAEKILPAAVAALASGANANVVLGTRVSQHYRRIIHDRIRHHECEK